MTTDARFVNPFWATTERLSGAAKRFADDVREVKRFGRELVEEARAGDKVGNESHDEEGEEDMRGLLLRELVKAHGDAEDTQFLADACLNFLTAGESIMPSNEADPADSPHRQRHHRASRLLDALPPPPAPDTHPDPATRARDAHLGLGRRAAHPRSAHFAHGCLSADQRFHLRGPADAPARPARGAAERF